MERLRSSIGVMGVGTAPTMPSSIEEKAE